MSVTKSEVAGIDLELFDSGSGAPLLFLHGAGGFAQNHPFVAPPSARAPADRTFASGLWASGLPDWLDRPDDIAHLISNCSTSCARGSRHGRLLGRRLDRRRNGDQGAGAVRAPSHGRPGRHQGRASPTSSTSPTSSRCRQPMWQKLIYHDPAKMTPDPAKMADEQTGRHVPRPRDPGAAGLGALDAQSQAQALAASRSPCPALFIRGESDGLVSADAYLQAYAQPAARTRGRMTVPPPATCRISSSPTPLPLRC